MKPLILLGCVCLLVCCGNKSALCTYGHSKNTGICEKRSSNVAITPIDTIKEGKEHLKAKYWLIFAIIVITMFFFCVGPRGMSTLIPS